MGVAAADIDNDGWVDLYVMNFGANQLWRNRGDGTFENITDKRRCGRRTLVCQRLVRGHQRRRLARPVCRQLLEARQRETARVQTWPSAFDDYCGPLRGAGETDRLFVNEGNGRFRDISDVVGRDQRLRRRAWAFRRPISTATVRLDIYVANDGVANQLWINQGDLKFVDDALLAGVSVNKDGMAEASMGVDAGDFDGDGDIDLFMTHLRQETNTLYVNDGQGLVRGPQRIAVGLAADSFSFTGFGTAWFDYDNDGWLDLIDGERRCTQDRSAAPGRRRRIRCISSISCFAIAATARLRS